MHTLFCPGQDALFRTAIITLTTKCIDACSRGEWGLGPRCFQGGPNLFSPFNRARGLFIRQTIEGYGRERQKKDNVGNHTKKVERINFFGFRESLDGKIP